MKEFCWGLCCRLLTCARVARPKVSVDVVGDAGLEVVDRNGCSCFAVPEVVAVVVICD